MKKLLIILSFFLLSQFPSVAIASSVASATFYVPTSGGEKKVTAVYVNLNDPSIVIKSVLPIGGIGATESLQSMAERSRAIVAMNGTFFNAYSDFIPQGSIFIDGVAKYLNDDATSLYFDSRHMPRMDYLKYKIKGSINGLEDWQHEWYAWNINHPFSESDSVVIYTPEWRNEIQPPYETVITVKNGIVINIGSGVTSVPENGYLICLGSSSSLDYMRAMFHLGDPVGYRVVPVTSNGMEVADLKTVINTGPTLTFAGQIAIDPAKEGMTDPHVLSSSSYRSMVGITEDNQLVMANVRDSTIPELAEVAQNIGLVYSLNGDGGASAGLYANGELLCAPGRQLANAIVVQKLEY